MRRVAWLAAVAGAVAWLVRRARPGTRVVEHVWVGFTDGSSETLEVGSPERELVLAAAEDVV